MYAIRGNNINDVFPAVVRLLETEGQPEETRNGPVLALQEPLAVTYLFPRERVLFCPERGENPFLHFFDGIFSLQPLNEAPFMFQFQERFRDYSDDGERFHGHYGERLGEFGQLRWAIDTLREDPASRRVVLQLFWPERDHKENSRDIPCNVSIALRIRAGDLDITVFNRSNDVMWGMLGANVVQFSMLHEYLAAKIGVPVGLYHQISNNAHVYTEMGPYREIVKQPKTVNAYRKPYELKPFPLVSNPGKEWLSDAARFVYNNGIATQYDNDFFTFLAAPAFRAWKERSLWLVDNLPDCDWKETFRNYGARKGWGR